MEEKKQTLFFNSSVKNWFAKMSEKSREDAKKESKIHRP